VLERLEAAFVYTEALRVSHAFHSRLMEPMLDAFERFARGVGFGAPRIPLFSNLTGGALPKGEAFDAAYLRRHVRSPVLFQRGIEAMQKDGHAIFLEIGPHDVLCQLGKKCSPGAPATWLPSLRRKGDDWHVLLGTAAALHVAGLDIDWDGFDQGYHRRRIALPTYPFERKRCWLESSEINSPYRTEGSP
jgi:acyl transferase domain-containing protein